MKYIELYKKLYGMKNIILYSYNYIMIFENNNAFI